MKKIQIILAVLIVAVILAVSPLYAMPMLRLSSGGTTVNLSDGSGLDANGAAGALTYIGPVGNFWLNVSTGFSKPAVGTVGLPSLDLNSINVSNINGNSSNADKTLTMMFTDVGFGPLDPGISGFSTSVGGTTQGTASFEYWIASDNTPFSKMTQLAGFGPFQGAFSDTAYMSLSPLSSFSLTNIATITHVSGQNISSFNQVVDPIPEPGTLLLLGSGVVGVVAYARRKKCLLSI